MFAKKKIKDEYDELSSIPIEIIRPNNIDVARTINKENILSNTLENINLENQNLDINLRLIHMPSYYVVKYDRFIKLNNSNLKGNQIHGSLSPFPKTITRDYEVYFWYSEDTFDEKYKEIYPEYFLDSNAPQQLKDLYYNPEEIQTSCGKVWYKKRKLDFETYLKYYQYLHFKSLKNFDISKKDNAKIRLLKLFGLETTKEILQNLSNTIIPLDTLLEIIDSFSNQEIIHFLSSPKQDINYLFINFNQTKERVRS